MDPGGVVTVPEAEDAASADMPTRLAHFEIVGRLGAGGMGVVFEARDAVLGRRVALKLLHPASSDGASVRLLREAQALAKLSHPNVVTVYEVGLAGDNPFVAMELVEGVTLREWTATDRDWRDVIDVFVAVGHGLAAAHALGLVHRDFKPSNVFVDQRGIPKLGDFGLVGASDAEAPAAPDSDPVLSASLTRTGAVMGTPAYMAPEQQRGESVDARADQFSFAKSLHESLSEPFPAALLPILERAQAPLVKDRYAAMGPLLEELARVRRGRRGLWVATGLTAAAVAVTAIAWGVGRSHTSAPVEACPAPIDRLTGVWSPARRLALEAHLRTLDPVRGAERFATIARTFDRGARDWGAQHVDACRMTHEGRQSDSLLDRRMTCLDRALYELDETVRVVETSTTVAMLDEATRAVVALPTLAACADVATLAEKLPPLTNPAQRSESTAITHEIIDIDVTLRTGGTRTGAEDRATAAVTRARALGEPATLADGLRVLAAVQIENEAAESVATLHAAITAAAAAHDDRSVATLWVRLLEALVKLKRATEAKTLLPAAEAAFARATPTLELSATALAARAQVVEATGDVSGALGLVGEAIAMLEREGAKNPGSPHAHMLIDVRMREAGFLGASDQWARAVTAFQAVLPLVEAQYGPDHPVAMRAYFNLGVAYRNVRDVASSLPHFREAARIGQARLAPSPSLAGLLSAVGSTYTLLLQPAEATSYLDQALAMSRATMPPLDPRLVYPIGALGATHMGEKRWDEARAAFAEEIEILEHNQLTDGISYASALYNLAHIDMDTGHCADGIPRAERALAIYEQIGENDHYDIDSARTLIAACHLALAHHADALRISAQVIATPEVDPSWQAWARYIHGRARFATGDKQGGIAEIRVARQGVIDHEVAELTAEQIDAWLGARGLLETAR